MSRTLTVLFALMLSFPGFALAQNSNPDTLIDERGAATWSLTIYASIYSRQGGPTTLPQTMTLSTCLEMAKNINTIVDDAHALFCSNHETGDIFTLSD